VLAWHKGRFVVPALDFCACTHARMHTRLFAAMVSRMQHLYSNTHILAPAQWPVPRLRGQESNCLALPRLHSFTSAPSPLAIIRGLFAPPRTQQCCKNGIMMSPICPCLVGAPLVVPGSALLAVLSSTQLRAPRRCPPAPLPSSLLCTPVLMLMPVAHNEGRALL